MTPRPFDTCPFCDTEYRGDARAVLVSSVPEFYRDPTERIYRFARCICVAGQRAEKADQVPVSVAWGTYYFLGSWVTPKRTTALVVEMIQAASPAPTSVILTGPGVLVEFVLATGRCRGVRATARGARPKLAGKLVLAASELELLRQTATRQRFLHLPPRVHQAPLTTTFNRTTSA